MNKSIVTILLLILGLTDAYSQLSKTAYEGVVEYFVNCIKSSDIDKLDSIISYPIKRPYPIPSIKDKHELKKRYSEIFDDSLTSIISNSNIKEDWTDVGWRGIMLNNGIVWLDYNGRFLTTNYTSKKAKILEDKSIKSERDLLYPGLKNFKKPIHTIQTDKFIVRVDLLENQKYRYASWSIESDLSKKPDLVICNGKRKADGSGGNHHYIFTTGKYSYVVNVTVLARDEIPEFSLEVLKNDKLILNQPAKLKELK